MIIYMNKMFLFCTLRESGPLLFFTYRRKVHAGNVVRLVNLRGFIMQPRLRFIFSFLCFVWPRYTSLPCVRFRPTHIHAYPTVLRKPQTPWHVYSPPEVPRGRPRVNGYAFTLHSTEGQTVVNTPLCASPEDARASSALPVFAVTSIFLCPRTNTRSLFSCPSAFWQQIAVVFLPFAFST